MELEELGAFWPAAEVWDAAALVEDGAALVVVPEPELTWALEGSRVPQ